MRVISGKFRSRPLRSLRGVDIRPTSDRLRETLFNVLTAGNLEALAGSTWLDLYAGTGAVGIEALSRGASMVYFVESSKAAVALIRANLASLEIDSNHRLLQQPVAQAVANLALQRIQPDFIFLDPPYRMEKTYAETLSFLGSSGLSSRALVIAEHAKQFDPAEKFGTLTRTRLLCQGDATLSFYRR